MKTKLRIPTMITALMIVFSCSSQETPIEPKNEKKETSSFEQSTIKEPHRYGGWYCPDNFGFVPVDISHLDKVPAISDRLPTEEELKDHKSLIKVDTSKYPDASALKMNLPRIARVNSKNKGMTDLAIIIQALTIGEDTIVGYRFPNGGNGSARISEVSFLSEEEVEDMGPQPFFYSKTKVNASKEEVWDAISKTEYGKILVDRFDEQELFSYEWYKDSWPHRKNHIKEGNVFSYAGIVFGNLYLQIDSYENGQHYSEKMLMIEDHENNTTELYFASGPYPDDFEKNKAEWSEWFNTIASSSVKN